MACYFESQQINIVTTPRNSNLSKVQFCWDLSVKFFRNSFYGLCGPFFRCGRSWGMRRPEICWYFFRRNFWDPVPLNRLFFFFLRTLFFLAELHYTNCVPDFCWFYFRRNFWGPVPPNRLQFSLRTMFFFSPAKLHYTNITNYVPDLCWKKMFSAELSIQTYGLAQLNITKCVVDFSCFP